jgi:hypothetical protein
MDSRKISLILNGNNLTKKCFKGVFSSNNIPKLFSSQHSYPFGFIANTDRAGERGTHWVAFFVPNNRIIEYFDSLAMVPNPEIKKFLNLFPTVRENSKKVQSFLETSCGPHCIYFIIRRCMGHSFNSIIKSLNHPYSDSHVKIFLIKLLNNLFN